MLSPAAARSATCLAFVVVGLAGWSLTRLTPLSAPRQALPSGPVPDFAAEVAPILSENCVACHGADKAKGKLRLDTRAGLLKGGENGPAVIPFAHRASELLKLVSSKDMEERMPPPAKKDEPPVNPLRPSEIATLERWVAAGAPWPSGLTLVPVDPRIARLEAEALTFPVVKLEVFPPEVSLDTVRDQQSVVVTATYADGTQRDVTALTRLTLPGRPPRPASEAITLKDFAAIIGKPAPGAPAISPVTGKLSFPSKVRPLASEFTVKVATVPAPQPVRFTTDVAPIITRAGCNTGGCHGAARGREGFHLSLFGYDPADDLHRLLIEMPGRRLNLAEPGDSLMLKKAVQSVPHEGGKRFDVGGASYQTILEWIQNGAQSDPEGTPHPVAVEVFPTRLTLAGEGVPHRLTVRARYSDGTDRDVTGLAVFSSTNPGAAKVSEFGVITTGRRGEAFVMARFHTSTVGCAVVVLPAHPGAQPGAELASETNYIDRAVGAKLARLRVTASPLCDDRTFLRRASLDIAGIAPSPAELDSFAAEPAPDKRARLVDRLLARPEFVDLLVMQWAELLQIRTEPQQGLSYKATLLYHSWLADRFARGVPFDQTVRDLISASGGTFDNPAANFYQSERDTLKLSENIAQVFVGARVQCSQCHNHPFDRWTLDDYYGWAAFFTQIGRKTGADPRETVIYNSNSGEAKHPVLKKGLAPKFLGGDTPDVKNKDRRAVVAEWLTAPDNPWFSRHVVNVLWARFFGVGIVEPVDDVRVSNPPSNPELLDALADRFRATKCDFRALVRDIVLSEAYQRSTQVNETNKLDGRNFSHGLVRRLRAEVLLDVISQITEAPDKFKGLPLGARAVEIADGNTSNYFLTTFGRAERETVCSCEVKLDPNLSQALHLLNGDTLAKKIRQGKVVEKQMEAKKTPSEIITDLYRRCLGRAPTEGELAGLLKELPPEPKELRPWLEDVFWALLNSKEFVFNH